MTRTEKDTPTDVVTRASLERLVRAFYGRAREDAIIGPIFMAAVKDWDHHIAEITEFWCSIILRTGTYSGRPMRPHLMLGLEERHFDRWLALFNATAHDIFTPDIAEALLKRARRIADSFELAIAAQRGEIKAPRHSRTDA